MNELWLAGWHKSVEASVAAHEYYEWTEVNGDTMLVVGKTANGDLYGAQLVDGHVEDAVAFDDEVEQMEWLDETAMLVEKTA